MSSVKVSEICFRHGGVYAWYFYPSLSLLPENSCKAGKYVAGRGSRFDASFTRRTMKVGKRLCGSSKRSSSELSTPLGLLSSHSP